MKNLAQGSGKRMMRNEMKALKSEQFNKKLKERKDNAPTPPKGKPMGESPNKIIGAIASAIPKVAKVAKVVGKVTQGVDAVKSAFGKKKEKEENSPATYKNPGGKMGGDRKKRPHLYKDADKKMLKDKAGLVKYDGPRSKGGLKVDPRMKKKTPNKWMLTAGKAILGGIKKKNAKEDARGAAKNAGVQSMQQV